MEKDREIQELQRKEKIKKKQHEKLHKNRETNELLVKDEMYNVNYIKRPLSRRGKRVTNELAEALKNRPVTNAEQILKEKQREMDADKFKKLLEDKKREEEQERKIKEEQEYNKKGIVSNQKLFIKIDNDNVFKQKSVYDASNIEDAVNIFNDDLPNINVLYRDFYERNLPIVKNQLPGMRLNQYKDKIKRMWKISYENPKNMFHSYGKEANPPYEGS